MKITTIPLSTPTPAPDPLWLVTLFNEKTFENETRLFPREPSEKLLGSFSPFRVVSLVKLEF